MDASIHKTCGTGRTVKPCGSGSPMLESSLQVILQAMVAKKPGTPGRARSSRQTIAQGVPVDFGVPVLACARLFCFARKAVGAACTRHSLRPLSSEGATKTQSSDAKSRRGDAEACGFVI